MRPPNQGGPAFGRDRPELGGKSWNYLGRGLPNAAVWDLQIHPRDNMIVLATNGRGMWVMDDASPVQK
jgi:hypothetical protein